MNRFMRHIEETMIPWIQRFPYTELAGITLPVWILEA